MGRPAAFIVTTKQHRAEAGARTGGVGKTANDEFLILGAFYLQPISAAARAIRRVDSLGNNAFEANFTSFVEHFGALGDPMLAVAQRSHARCFGVEAQQPL